PLGAGAPTVVKESGTVSVVYRRLVSANPPQYVVQSSTELRNWSTVTPSETVVGTAGEVQTIKATVPASGSRLFLRVLINPPTPSVDLPEAGASIRTVIPKPAQRAEGSRRRSLGHAFVD
ncbi:MAG: hypothetical protein ABI992_12685, partial [Chthoniobacterales bacterium]